VSAAAVLEVRGLGKRYAIGGARAPYKTLRESLMRGLYGLAGGAGTGQREFWALRDVSFDLARGEVLGVLGSNGAGKSTLLKLLARITAPTEGSALLHGRLGSLLEIGTGFHPELSGRENVYLSGAILGMPRAEIRAKFDAIVDFSGVEDFLDTPVKRYSSGMYVRLAFAVAAFLEQEILVVDEVLAVGDAEFQRKCLGRLSEVSGQEGRTVLFVSHNMSAIHQLCSRSLLLENGRVAFDGGTEEGIRRYLSGVGDGAAVEFRDVHKGRRGERQYFQLERLEALDEDGRPCRVFQMGARMRLRLTLVCRKPWREPRLGIMLTNTMDVLIHDFTSAFDGFFPSFEPGRHCVEVEVGALNVYPGSYRLGAWIQQALGLDSDDYARGALAIEVVDGRRVGHERAAFDQVSKANTEVYVPCRWNLLPPAT
jgi:lipopolysaccharide transport system ATP-binding protein